MWDAKHGTSDRGRDDAAGPTQREVGRGTLVGQLAFEPPPQRPPLFAAPTEWEAIDPRETAQVALDTSHEQAQEAHLDTLRGPANQSGTMIDAEAAAEPQPADDEHAEDAAGITDAEAEATQQHAAMVRSAAPAGTAPTAHAASAAPVAHAAATRSPAPTRHHGIHHGDYHAPTSIYNPRVHSNKDHDGHGQQQLGRPGVRVHGKDVYQLAQSPAPRYRIVSGTKAVKTDQLFTGDEIAINVAHVKKLVLDGGTRAFCVLAWEATHGPAWLPLHYIKGNTSLIQHTANRLAKRDLPAVARRKDYDHVVRYQFRDEPQTELGHSHPTAREKTEHISPRTTSGANMLDHYLERETATRLAPSDPAGAPHSPNDIAGERRYYSVCLTLPQQGTPPVACDTAAPNDVFFVPHGAKFTEKIAIYNRGKHANKVIHMQPWVYGFLGKVENGKWVPDHARRGWVPLRDLIKK